ncbi:hypothetical protein FPY71_01685 [Aureimonas fodinaquatilis]|uniref:DUF937 domain-containing protein n=1 Tax=Aureimonas fodinaquatilis TaxID=2565783 RepID=A0A5B0DYG2_9HYPH|nr:hypothetical protein [Aureimonas fodinaquatilis]KAA0971867.1 hypothetical protein FPY71_01685 [Aureimonas fodinaquatilis]
MTTFADWLAASAGMQNASEQLQAQFRLSEKEIREATEALAPALMLGMKRMMANQAQFAEMSRQFAAFPAAGSDAFGQKAMLGLFGSRDLADAVARQASLISGLAPDTLAQMIPIFSSLTVDSIMHTLNASTGRKGALPGDSAGVLLAEMMRRSANAMDAFSRPSHSRQNHPTPHSTEEIGRMFAEALKGFPFVPRTSDSAPKEPPPAASPFDTAFDFLEAGRSFQDSYMREMMSLFERHDETKKD